MHLIIANKLYSSWSLRPWLVMSAFGLPFEETIIPLRQTDTGPRILEKSPSGRVPALVDGDVTVWESLAIIEYLAEKFPGHAIWPRDAKARAHARAIANEMHAGFQPLRAACGMNLAKRFKLKEYAPDVTANIARIVNLWAEARARFGTPAKGAAAGPFLYGAFSAADAMYAPVVTRFDTYQIPVDAQTRAYMDALRALPAFVAWRTAALAEPWSIPAYEVGHTAVETFHQLKP